MKNLIALLILLAGSALMGQDLNMSVLAIPDELKENAGSVVRSHEKVYTVLSANTATIYERKVITILNDDHDRENQFVVFYDEDSKITSFKATLYDAMGDKVRSAKKSEIEDVSAISGGQFYTDSRVQTTTLTHLSYPYTVAFEYEKKLKNFGVFEFPQWLPMGYNQSVMSSSFTARVPMDNELLFRSNELPDPETATENGRRAYRWLAENMPARKSEALAPPMSQTLPYLRTVLRNFDTGEYKGDMQSWESFGEFMWQLVEGRSELPPQLQALVKETTAGLPTDKEKIDALYRLLQDRTRYVGVQLGIGGFQPFSAEYVETNRYGDCKALSNYMGAMLDEIGIESYHVLISSSKRQFFPVQEDFATSAFNHMILYVPSEDMYLECTSNDFPTGYISEGTQDRNVLLVTPNGGKLVRTPKSEPADNGYTRTVDLSIQPDGNADFKLHGSFYGASQEMYRGFANSERNQAKQLEWFNRRGTLPDVNGTNYSLTVEADEPKVEMTYQTNLRRYSRKLGTRMFVPINKFYSFDNVPDKLTERRYPIHQLSARFYVDTVNLTYPEEMEIESLGEALTTIEHAAGEYRAEVKSSPGKLTWIRTLKLVPVELPAEAYADYRQFFVDVAKADRRQIVIKTRKSR
ncbi:DUF3857 domain-containing protein [Neolewinella agarilytica]|uniref:DUF3857 domain-containing protein n=1 Tax=Neolewinella agarilytica TaxID=478744 RepID=UPI00235229D3|nr:DUF3857 domain-containing protein [Neolewinella agarilytica]